MSCMQSFFRTFLSHSSVVQECEALKRWSWSSCGLEASGWSTCGLEAAELGHL